MRSAFHGKRPTESMIRDAEEERMFVNYEKPIPCKCGHAEDDHTEPEAARPFDYHRYCTAPMCPCQQYRAACPF